MVNPVIYPVQRRGPSGPEAFESGGSTDFLPSDNLLFFDPYYSGGANNGSIAGPFLTWSNWVLGATFTEGVSKVVFPGVPVTPDLDALPIVAGYSLTLEGIQASEDASYIDDAISIPSLTDIASRMTFRHLALEALELNGGNYQILFDHCLVNDLIESAGSFIGDIHGEQTGFNSIQDTADAGVILTGGYLVDWTARFFELNSLRVGTPDSVSAGQIVCTGTSVRCKDVTFVEGSTIDFSGDQGELYLDPVSYRSFLVSSVVLTNGHVTRDDGSWPRDAEVYTSVAAPGVVDIDFYLNPRAILELDSGGTTAFISLTAPLTREVELTTVQGEGGSVGVVWPTTGLQVLWSDGDTPDQDTTPGCVTQYRFDYEEDSGLLIGYVVAMKAELAP